MERLKHIKENLMCAVEAQMYNLEEVDAKELGEVVDMIKDIEEAIYYCTITKAMEGKEKEGGNQYHHYYTEYRDMDRPEGRMYYPGDNSSNHTSMSSGGNTRSYMEWNYPMERDHREGRSPMSRKTYMEAKEMHQPKTTQMKELEKYLQELSSDIIEMIQDASPEEKSFLEKKISALAAKINQAQ
jgi:hypothetical protein